MKGSKGFRFGWTFTSLLIVVALVLPWTAWASSVDVATVDVTAPTGSVTLLPGASASIVINMTVLGNQEGTATFKVYRDWTLTGGTFTGSNSETFTVSPRAAKDPATMFSTSGTVTVAAGQSVGDFALAVSAFDITNSNPTGAKLSDGADSNYQVTVSPSSDTTPPVITPSVSGTLGNNGWYVSDVSVTWTVTDLQSDITSQIDCGPTTISDDTAGTTLTCQATSAGGTASQSVTIKRDATPPTISGAASPDPNAAGWNKTDVTVSFNCSDGTSGIASCGPNQTLGSEGAGQSATGTAVDNAGNSNSATVSGINIDKTPPAFGACPAGGPFLLNSGLQSVGPISVDPAISGLNAAASTQSGSVDTSSLGTKSVTFTATDNADNWATKTCDYGVIYKWTGFFRPVDNLPVLNAAKAGSAIPIKFSLNGNQGLGIFAASYPKSAVIACDSTAAVDAIEETVTAGSSSLSYDPLADQYVYVWKTEKTWTGCRQLVVKLVDGMEYRANFKFTK